VNDDRLESYFSYLKRNGLKSSTLSKKKSLLKKGLKKLRKGEKLTVYEEKEVLSFQKFLKKLKEKNAPFLKEAIEELERSLAEKETKGKKEEDGKDILCDF